MKSACNETVRRIRIFASWSHPRQTYHLLHWVTFLLLFTIVHIVQVVITNIRGCYYIACKKLFICLP
jgi:hypothetical protein